MQSTKSVVPVVLKVDTDRADRLAALAATRAFQSFRGVSLAAYAPPSISPPLLLPFSSDDPSAS